MNGKQVKKLRGYAKKFAKQEMLANILVYQSLPLWDRARICWAILMRRGDGTPEKGGK